ncbi:phosphoribosylformylglycinamidine synthase [Klebsiella pneumoniae]|nr:phosphoribosylformylglycinamidine synthase [Klebsiella pneumoniae]
MQALVAQRKLLAYHDRSDGGLLVTLAEMAFTGHCGVEADIAALGDDHLAALFNEELGAVIQVRAADRERWKPFWRLTAWRTACITSVKRLRAIASC